jgi:hypothetical protein
VYNKTARTSGQWSYGAVNAYNVFDRTWNHSALQLGWTDQSGNNYFLRASGSKKYEAVDLRRFLEEVTFNFVHKYSPATRFGVEVILSLFRSRGPC